MKKRILAGLVISLVAILSLGSVRTIVAEDEQKPAAIALPQVNKDGKMSVEKALSERRSVRQYKNEAAKLADLGQILWAAQGVTNERNFRTAPSAGATFPLETYAVVGNVEGLEAGVYKYDPLKHQLLLIEKGDKRVELSNACLKQGSLKSAPFSVVFAAVYERTSKKYGERAKMYVHMEAGHAAQNVYLQATAINYGAVAIGAFDENELAKVVKFAKDEQPVYLLAVGKVQ